MVVLPTREQIKKSNYVSIETKENQGTENLTSGIVGEILTSSSSHPHGIMVRLQDGQIGRVKSIEDTQGNTTESISDKSIGIRTKSKEELSNIAKKAVETRRKNHQEWSQKTEVKNIKVMKGTAAPRFIDLDKKEIPKNENKYNEFKEFYQYDEKLSELPSNENRQTLDGIKRSVLERFATAVCSFGNDYKGGFVYLGIKSDGTIAGLDKDKKFGGFLDYDDSFANNMRNRLGDMLEDKVFITSKLQIGFKNIDDKIICIIQILPSKQPLYVHSSKQKTFYVRGPTPRAEKLDGRDQFRYIKERFPNYG